MKARLFATMLAVVFASATFAAEEENPYKKSKVGDFATYKVTTKVAGLNIEGTMTQTVTAKDDKEATVSSTGQVNGMDIPAQEQKIDLSKPYDPTKGGNIPAGANVTTEKLKDGTEKVKVGAKEYAAKWETFKMKVKNAGMEFDADMKVWTAKDSVIPLVKMELTADVMGNKMEVLMEMNDSGNKPVAAKPEEKKKEEKK